MIKQLPPTTNYTSPVADTVETMHEGILCSSTNSIDDVIFEFDETLKD